MANEESNEVAAQFTHDPLTAARLNALISSSCPSGTLDNCAEALAFMGHAAAAVDRDGGAGYGNGISWLLSCIESALRYESERVLYGRKEPGAAAAEAGEALQ